MSSQKEEKSKSAETKAQPTKKLSNLEKLQVLVAGDEIVLLQFVFLKLLAGSFAKFLLRP